MVTPLTVSWAGAWTVSTLPVPWPSIRVGSGLAATRGRLLVIVNVSGYVPEARTIVSPFELLAITEPMALHGAASVRQSLASDPYGATYQNVAARIVGA